MDKAKLRVIERKRRAARVRKTIIGSTERPRLCVRRSLKHIYAQIVDDVTGKTLVYVGSNDTAAAAKIAENTKAVKKDAAKIVGEIIAERAIEKGIKTVVFDRKGYLYHGRIKALADAARAKGLVF